MVLEKPVLYSLTNNNDIWFNENKLKLVLHIMDMSHSSYYIKLNSRRVD